jgi:anti-sigma B factor antagonist
MSADAEGPVPPSGEGETRWAAPPRELADVRLEDHDGVTVAVVSGEVDMASVERVTVAVTDLSNLASGLVVDLRSVSYLDSSGISLLHDLALRLRRRSQLLVIVSPPGSPPRRMLELTALDAQAVVLDALEPAIEAIRAAYTDGSLADGAA